MVISAPISTQLLKNNGFGRLIIPFRENGILDDPTKWTETKLGSILPKIGLTEAETEKFFESFDRNYKKQTITLQPLDEKLERARNFYRSVTTNKKLRMAQQLKVTESDDSQREHWLQQRRKIAILSKNNNCHSDMDIFYHLLEEKSSLKDRIKTLEHLLEMSQKERQKICPTVDLRKFTDLLKTYKETKAAKRDLQAEKQKTFDIIQEFRTSLQEVCSALKEKSCVKLKALTTRSRKLQKNVDTAKAKIEEMCLQREEELKKLESEKQRDAKNLQEKLESEKQRDAKNLQEKFQAEKLKQAQTLEAKFEAERKQQAIELEAKWKADKQTQAEELEKKFEAEKQREAKALEAKFEAEKKQLALDLKAKYNEEKKEEAQRLKLHYEKQAASLEASNIPNKLENCAYI